MYGIHNWHMLCVRVWLVVVLVWFGFDFGVRVSHLTALRMGGSHSMETKPFHLGSG